MDENWKKGDLALCIKLGPWVRVFDDGEIIKSDGPPAGKVLTVRSVGFFDEETAVLKFSDWPDQSPFRADRFCKIIPKQMDEEDTETIRLLNGESQSV